MSDTQLQLQAVQARADELGIKYHHRAGAAKIQAAIDALLKLDEGCEPKVKLTGDGPPPYEPPMTEQTYRAYMTGMRRKAAGNLVRCRVTCMNPEKKNWPGEIISVGSSRLGTFKKYIPYNGQPYHIPRIIYDHLKDRECSVFVDKKNERGHITRRGKLIKEYAIDVLDPLTKEEYDELYKLQQLRKGQS